jgi:hypothetical protein
VGGGDPRTLSLVRLGTTHFERLLTDPYKHCTIPRPRTAVALRLHVLFLTSYSRRMRCQEVPFGIRSVK